MKQKSWHLDRKSFLQSSGICLGLPWLECMSNDNTSQSKPRFFAGYFPYGVPMIEDDNKHRLAHGWFPLGGGENYKMTDMQKPFSNLRQDISYTSGLSHPSMRKTSAHKGADVFLTGSQILNTYQNQSVSIDQVIANSIGQSTRFPSLVLSSFGGVNRPYRSSTLSFDQGGSPIPSQSMPKEIFRRLFGKETEREKNALTNRASILDELMRETKSLKRKLGSEDNKKIDEYVSSVRDVENLTSRAEKWQKIPKPKVDASELDLNLSPADIKEYIDLMYKFVVLAFQTDSTRVCTFQVAAEANSIAMNFPSAIGIKKNAHSLSHESKDYTEVASYLTFLNERYAKFLKTLKSTKEGDSNLLDNTFCFYGCATSKTHRAINYPIILSGGKSLGFKHGSHYAYSDDIPLSNLFLTIAQQYEPSTMSFADSNSTISEILV